MIQGCYPITDGLRRGFELAGEIGRITAGTDEIDHYDGTLERIHHTLYVACRERVGREVSPTAAIIDSQSVKGAEKGGARSTRPATTRARRSGARSATSWSTRRAC